ncbi:hypothetical protein [Methylomicrobium sp. Wu6]|uniref:hypothetical protein n=1 Tax=Methylomicrobium sp. Wu6 TaxID=3107928 RepID=UPI002DD67EC5|nr:hypothetical protein [Methylomicrobium sp. Wu6]MEC4747208.1 hypothetical protein [Methylomicrobium sp. Wu6]
MINLSIHHNAREILLVNVPNKGENTGSQSVKHRISRHIRIGNLLISAINDVLANVVASTLIPAGVEARF